MKALELLLLQHYLSMVLQDYPPVTISSATSPLPSNSNDNSTSASNKRPTSSSPRGKAKQSKSSNKAIFSESAPPTPLPASKWTTRWVCTNCLNKNQAESLLCEFCSHEQPDPASSTAPIIIDGESAAASNKVLQAKGNSAEETIDLLSSSDEEDEALTPIESTKVKQEFTPVGFGEGEN